MGKCARVVVPGVSHHVTQGGNRRMDVFLDDTDGVTGEDDLALLTFQFTDGISQAQAGTVTIGLSGALKLWKESTKETQVTDLSYDLATDWEDFSADILNKTLYVEGYTVSAALHDATVVLTYSLAGKSANDTVRYTVVKADLDAIDVAVADALEVTEGAFVGVNNDDDEDDVEDREDTDGVTGEDDLLVITLQQMVPAGLPGTDTVALTWTEDAKIDVFESSDKTDPISTGKTYQLSALPKTLYVEGDEESDAVRDVELELKYTRGTASHSDKLKVTVVKVDLDAEGVSDANEVSVGAFVIINDDDDDEDGTADKDETSGSVSNENDLIELTLRQVLPAALPGTDTVELTWTGGTRIKIYENSDRTDSISSGQTYQLSALPKTLHVEGNSAGSSTVELKYTKGGTTIKDRVIFTVGTLGMYRDSVCANALDDHAKDGGLLRSPKYVFGKEDNIHIKVTGLTGLGDSYFQIQVTSESDATGVPIDLDDIGSGVYKNTLGEHLRLLSLSYEWYPADFIEVIDEEVINFTVKVNGTEIGEKDVMVDRGEWLAIAGSESQADELTLYDDYNENIATAKTEMENDHDWYGNGYLLGYRYNPETADEDDGNYEASKQTAFDQGYDADKSCADVLFATCHGAGASLHFCTYVNAVCPDLLWYTLPATAGAGWEHDVEFVVAESCSVLGSAADHDAFVAGWINDVFDEGIHAVLGTSDDISSGALNDDFGPFVEKMAAGTRVLDAWKSTCYEGWNTEYGILVRQSNLNDYLETPVSSTSKSLTRDSIATDVNFVYYWYDDEDELIEPAAADSRAAYLTIREKLDAILTFEGEVEMDVLAVVESPHNQIVVSDDAEKRFDHLRRSSALVTLWKDAEQLDNVTYGRTTITEDACRTLVEQHGMTISEDYVLHSRGRMMVREYQVVDGNALGSEPWCEGEVLSFVRTHEGKKLVNERAVVALKKNFLWQISLSRHEIKPTGRRTVKKPRFDFTQGNLDPANLHAELAYIVEKDRCRPVWQIRYGKYAYLYDAETGERLR